MALFFEQHQHMELSIRLRHHRVRTIIPSSERLLHARAQSSCFIFSQFFLSYQAPAQVTHGQKPKLPAPFRLEISRQWTRKTDTSRRIPGRLCPRIRVNVFATNFKRPRWLTVAPNGDIFLADMGSGEIIVMRDPGQKPAEHKCAKSLWMGRGGRSASRSTKTTFTWGNTNEVVRFAYDPIDLPSAW